MTKNTGATIDQYSIIVIPLPDQDGGGFLAHVPDLPGCMGDGATPEQAVTDVRRAMVEWLDSCATPPRATSWPPEAFLEHGEVPREVITAFRADMAARFGIGQGKGDYLVIDDPFQRP